MIKKCAGIAIVCLILLITPSVGPKIISAQPCPSDDNDDDGYPEFASDCSVIDCNDNDPAVNPGATEVLFNGKDDDCIASTFDNVTCIWEAFSAGVEHTVALKTDGSLWTWGWNDRGQLGDDSISWSSVPSRIGLYNDWSSVAAGYYHSAALKTDGTLWIWGWNSNGQLGDGTTADRGLPAQMGSDNTWIAIAAGHAHTVGLKSDGTIWAWGMNNFGQLGDGTISDRYVPVQTGTDSDWVSIAAGAFHTVGRKSDGSIWAWGANTFGQLGDGTTINRLSPVRVGTDINWNLIAAGYAQTYAIRNGRLYAWGWNKWGALGDGSTIDRHSPVQVGTEFYWAAINGGYHTVASKSDGTLWAWGYNSSGELGDGTTTDRLVPVKVGAGGDWASIAAGVWHTIASQSDGTVWAWGMNNHFQMGTTKNGLYPHRIERIDPAYDYDGDRFDCSVDCDNSDPDINPWVTEIPYDGIDQNCDGADGYDIYVFNYPYVLNYHGDTGFLADWFLSDFHNYSKLTFGPDGYLYGMEMNYYGSSPFSCNNPIGYDVETKEIMSYGGWFNVSTDLVFGPDRFIYGLTDNLIEVFDPQYGYLENWFDPGIHRESRLAFGPDGYLYTSYGYPVSSGGTGNIVNVINITTGEIVRSFPTDFDHSYGIAFGPDGYLYGYSPGYPASLMKGYNPDNGMVSNSFALACYPTFGNFLIDSEGNLYIHDYQKIFVYDISSGSLQRDFYADMDFNASMALGPRLISEPLNVRVDELPYPIYYSTIQNAYNDVPYYGAIQIKAVDYYEDLNFNLNEIVYIASGYNSTFSDVAGISTINGNMTINDGTLIIIQAYDYYGYSLATQSVTVINGTVTINAGSLILVDGNLVIQ